MEPNPLRHGANRNTPLQLRFLKTVTIEHVSRYVLFYIDSALAAAGIEPMHNPQGKFETIAAKIVSRLGLTGNLRRSSRGPVFVTCMSPSESKLLPFAYWTEIIPYCFDCWEPGYEAWKSFFSRHRVRLAFFPARQSAQYFAKALPAMKSVWLPEATDPSEYQHEIKLVDRDIDVLELGRKHDGFHSSIAPVLAAKKRVHLFEKAKGEIVFADKASFTNGIGRSKISVCFPCSQTHVQRSGSIETVTHRYFESIASKCIILGHGPAELSDLFGYNPVVEIETGREGAQIESVLSNLDSFQDLVERNYERLLEVGTWRSRVCVVIEEAGELASHSAPNALLRREA
jgi:hypothetical protein